MTDHPITPPSELLQQWFDEEDGVIADYLGRILVDKLSAARRPKPPSLAEQALRHVGAIQDNWAFLGDGEHASPSLTGQITYSQLQDIRRALERLQELENK